MKRLTMHVLAVTFVLGLLVAACPQARCSGDNKVLPPSAVVADKTLSDWIETYWRWYFTSDHAQPAMVGPVALMPLPAGEWTSGSGTPEDPNVFTGQLEVTLPPGTPFVLPAVGINYERYDPSTGWPDDTPMTDEQFMTTVTDTQLTLDGKPILQNFWDYFMSRPMDPIIEYPAPTSYGSVATLYIQSVGFVAAPLAPGTHTLRLYEKYITPWWALIYDNTWTIKVVPPGRNK